MRRHVPLVLGCLPIALAARTAHGQCDPELLPFPEPTDNILSLTSYNGELVMGRQRPDPRYVARWTGSAWEPIGAPHGPNGPVNALITYNGWLIAGGSIFGGVTKWDGSGWSSVGYAMGFEPLTVRALAVQGGRLFAGGTFVQAGHQPVSNIAVFDGADWHAMSTGCDKQVLSLTIYDDELIAGGEFTEAGGRSVNHVASWDGSAWRPLGGGLDGSVSCLAVYRGELYAGGLFRTAGGRPMPLVSRFDGVEWQDVGGGLAHTTPFLGAITSLTVFNDQLIATGNFKLAGGKPVQSIARWTGTEWIGMPGFTTFPFAALVHDGDLYAGGFSAELQRFACPPCTADFDRDGQVDYCDMLDFVNFYEDQNPKADLNDDGFVNSADWLIFFDAYAAGCP